jgi:hypothetical protein
VLPGEAGQYLLRIVADDGQPDAVLAEILDATLQLDQLRSAERSPIRRAHEHQHGTPTAHDGLKRALSASVIAECEVGDARADLRSEL